VKENCVKWGKNMYNQDNEEDQGVTGGRGDGRDIETGKEEKR